MKVLPLLTTPGRKVLRNTWACNSLKLHGQVMSPLSPQAHARICLKLWRRSVLVFTYSDISQRRPIFLTSSYMRPDSRVKLSGVPSKGPQSKETPVGKDTV